MALNGQLCDILRLLVWTLCLFSSAVLSQSPDVYRLLPNGTDVLHNDDVVDLVTDPNQTFTPYPLPIRYREPMVDEGYRSSDIFDAKGMQPVYLLASLLLDNIQLANLPPGLFDSNTTIDNVFQVVLSKKEELLIHHIGLIAAAAFGIFLAVVVLIGGCIFCICRCAGKCGARASPYEKQYDPCKRISCGLVLSILVILVIFGIVCAFVTNQYMKENVNVLPTSLNNGLDDIALYQNNTKIEVHNLLVSNFQQLENTLDSILDRCGYIVQMHLADVSKALAVENLTNIVSGLGAVRMDLNGIVQNTQLLQKLAGDLEHTLNASRQKLRHLLSICIKDEGDFCPEILKMFDIDNLRVKPDFGMLPDVTEVAREISRLIKENIETEVRKGKESLDGISDHIQNAVNNTIPQIKRLVRDVGADLEKNSQRISINIDQEVELQPARDYVVVLREYVDSYASIRYYASVAMCSVILLITLLFTVGLFCGFCGRKPNYVYGNESCTKGTGARLIFIAVYLLFLSYFFLMLLTTALFLVGGISTRIICDPIVNDPNSSEVLKLIEVAAKAYDVYPKRHRHTFSIAETLHRCHNNESVYAVLNLESEVNIDAVTNYRQRFRMKDKIKELTDKISITPGITILTSQAKQHLLQLADSRISDINFTAYADVLNREIVDVNFPQLLSALNSTIASLQAVHLDLSRELLTEVLLLEGMQNKILIPIHDNMEKLRKNLRNLQQDIRFNKSSFREGIQDLIFQAEKAQHFIQNQGRSEVINLAHKLADNFTSYLDDYANRVNFQVKEEIGKCWPVSKAVNASIMSVCHGVIDPLNGFWASMGWCLLLFIPCIFLAVRLSSLYQKTDLHSLPSMESSHRDKKRKRKTQVYDNHNGYIHDASPGYANGTAALTPTTNGGYHPASTCDYSSGTEGYELDDPHTFRNIPVKSSSPSSRTPLQEWDYQGEAPPQYNSATNLTVPDFERPPPYYFPGPSPVASKF